MDRATQRLSVRYEQDGRSTSLATRLSAVTKRRSAFPACSAQPSTAGVYPAATALGHSSLAVLTAARQAAAPLRSSWCRPGSTSEAPHHPLGDEHDGDKDDAQAKASRNLATSLTFARVPDDRIAELRSAAKAQSSEQRSFRFPDAPTACQGVPRSRPPISGWQFPVAAQRVRPPLAKDRYPTAPARKACKWRVIFVLTDRREQKVVKLLSKNRNESRTKSQSFTELHRLLCFHELHSGLVKGPSLGLVAGPNFAVMVMKSFLISPVDRGGCVVCRAILDPLTIDFEVDQVFHPDRFLLPSVAGSGPYCRATNSAYQRRGIGCSNRHPRRGNPRRDRFRHRWHEYGTQ